MAVVVESSEMEVEGGVRAKVDVEGQKRVSESRRTTPNVDQSERAMARRRIKLVLLDAFDTIVSAGR